MLVLGVNAYHGDASACLLVDGRLVAAVEEERFTRRKHQAGFPASAVRWCLAQAGARIRDVDHVAISRNPLVHLPRKVWRVLADRPSLGSLRQRLGNQRRVLSLRDALAAACDTDPAAVSARVHRVEHHRAHLASAFLCSPHERAVCVSLDGMGDFSSGMWARGDGNRMDVRGAVTFPHSLGVSYTAFTQFLGMHAYGDEYKLMGLAAYGEPRFLDLLRRVVRLPAGGHPGYRLDLDFFVHHRTGVDMTWPSGAPRLGRLWSPRLAAEAGPPREPGGEVTDRDRDLACSVQARLEEVELELLRRIHAHNPRPELVLAGGVALNCTVNGRIRADTPFEEVWVQPAASDAGTAVGAALWVWNHRLGMPRTGAMEHVFLGPGFDGAAADLALKEAGLDAEVVCDPRELADRVARHLAGGAVVGLCQGRSEFGPRALGHRSILCDPRRADVRDVLNERIKLREPFRPFAPSVLAERAADWFEVDGGDPARFMLASYPVRAHRREQIPAVTHADGTARVQTVDRDQNPRFHAVIAAFERRTGVPVVLNTSFNENEPIVNTAAEAVACFARTGMDVLVLGDRIVDRVGPG